MQRKLLGVLPIGALLFACLVIAGCGSSSSTTSSTATITKAEFIAKGNAICAAGHKTQEAAFKAYTKKAGLKENQKATKAQQVEILQAVLLPSIQAQANAIKALGAPSGESQHVDAALEATQQALNKVKANPQILEKEDPFHEAGQQLHELGLTRCARHT